jgi:hypothetical protein
MVNRRAPEQSIGLRTRPCCLIGSLGSISSSFTKQMTGRYLVALIPLVLAGGNMAAAAAGRNINDIPAARESVRRIVSSKFYRSLLISPVEGWIVVRGELAGDHLLGPRVIHSELNGTYDSLALELASNLQILNYTQSETSSSSRAVLVNLLIYQIADAKMAISFAYFEEPGGSQLRYSGAAWMAVRKANKWVTIDPLRLSPGERRGPRAYAVAVETPGSLRSLRGNGRLPTPGLSIQGGQGSALHTTRSY